HPYLGRSRAAALADARLADALPRARRVRGANSHATAAASFRHRLGLAARFARPDPRCAHRERLRTPPRAPALRQWRSDPRCLRMEAAPACLARPRLAAAGSVPDHLELDIRRENRPGAPRLRSGRRHRRQRQAVRSALRPGAVCRARRAHRRTQRHHAGYVPETAAIFRERRGVGTSRAGQVGYGRNSLESRASASPPEAASSALNRLLTLGRPLHGAWPWPGTRLFAGWLPQSLPAEAVICQMPPGTAELRGTVHVNGIAALSVLNWSLSGLRSTSRRATVGNIRLTSEVDRQ